MEQANEKSVIEQLKAWVLIPVALLFSLVFIAIDANMKGTDWWKASQQLLHDVLPSAVVVILTSLAAYYFFARIGVSAQQQMTDDIVKGVSSKIPSITPATTATHPEILEFWDTFRNVDWDLVFADARTIDIAVIYFDTWVKSNYERIEAFFKRGGVLRIFVADPEGQNVQANANQFPEHSLQAVKDKITGTGTRLEGVYASAMAQSARLEVYHLDRVFKYCAIRVNGERLLLSPYEMYRHNKIDSCAIFLNLAASEHLHQHWDSEFGGIRGDAKSVLTKG